MPRNTTSLLPEGFHRLQQGRFPRVGVLIYEGAEFGTTRGFAAARVPQDSNALVDQVLRKGFGVRLRLGFWNGQERRERGK